MVNAKVLSVVDVSKLNLRPYIGGELLVNDPLKNKSWRAGITEVTFQPPAGTTGARILIVFAWSIVAIDKQGFIALAPTGGWREYRRGGYAIDLGHLPPKGEAENAFIITKHPTDKRVTIVNPRYGVTTTLFVKGGNAVDPRNVQWLPKDDD